MRSHLIGCLACLALLAALAAPASAQTPDGAALYQQSCASCHDGGADRAPDREALRTLPAARVLAAMETGPMISMATSRTAPERRW